MGRSFFPLPCRIELLEDECWWGGRAADGVSMPFTAQSRHRVELHSDLRSNQGAPLLVSSLGRYLWSERPFTYEFEKGSMRLTGSVHPVLCSDGHGTLAGAFRAAAKEHFPASGIVPPEDFFAEPQYNTWIELNYDQTQAGVLDYAKGIVDHGFPPGVLMIDDGWFEYVGHLDFHPGRFPDPRAMMRQLKSWGFRVMLWISPYFSADSREYRRWRDLPGWFLRRRDQSPEVLAWWNGQSAHLDLTHPEAVEWFHHELGRLQKDYDIDGFKFDAGDTAHFINRPASWLDAAPADLNEAWARLGLNYPFNEFRACWKMGGQALVQRLHDRSPLWDESGLASLMPNALALGLLGHPFVCPDMVGGGDYMYFHRPDFKVDEELFVRWTQTSALFPMMQFSSAPWRVLSKESAQLCFAAVQLRASFCDLFLQEARASAKSGEPILRSLEYQFSGHGYALVKDQFMIGDTLMVAPMILPGGRTRRVKIPPGNWRDDRGDSVSGPQEIEVEVPLERLPHWRLKVSS